MLNDIFSVIFKYSVEKIWIDFLLLLQNSKSFPWLLWPLCVLSEVDALDMRPKSAWALSFKKSLLVSMGPSVVVLEEFKNFLLLLFNRNSRRHLWDMICLFPMSYRFSADHEDDPASSLSRQNHQKATMCKNVGTTVQLQLIFALLLSNMMQACSSRGCRQSPLLPMYQRFRRNWW